MISLAAVMIAPLQATTVRKMDLPALVSAADSIVQGRVESIDTRWEENLAFTYVSIRVADPLKGERRRSVMIRQAGGKIGSLNVTVAGSPVFKNGDEVIVFLKGQAAGTYHVVGMNQGKYEIVEDFAIANVSGLTLLDAKTGQMSDAGFVDKAPLEAFKTKIRELVR